MLDRQYLGKTLGILGGGQLGKMLAISALNLGFKVNVYASEKQSVAFNVASKSYNFSYENTKRLEEFFENCDFVTYEFENITLPKLSSKALAKLKPSLKILETCQDRIKEKTFLNSINIKTANFRKVNSNYEVEIFLKEYGPSIIKTVNFGYDGKGQFSLNYGDSLPKLNFLENKFIIEQKVSFEKEASTIVARNENGQVETFPIAHNTHENGILRQSNVPSNLSGAVESKMQNIAKEIANNLNLEGILTVEFFITKNGDVIVNELAPRPHNSGHFSLDGCNISQFEQTVRAVFNLPLLKPILKHETKMINILGSQIFELDEFYKNPKARVYIYGKKIEGKGIKGKGIEGRKLGHINIWL